MKKKEFIKFYESLSDIGKRNLVLNPYGAEPMSIDVCYLEISNDTILGKRILGLL